METTPDPSVTRLRALIALHGHTPHSLSIQLGRLPGWVASRLRRADGSGLTLATVGIILAALPEPVARLHEVGPILSEIDGEVRAYLSKRRTRSAFCQRYGGHVLTRLAVQGFVKAGKVVELTSLGREILPGVSEVVKKDDEIV